MHPIEVARRWIREHKATEAIPAASDAARALADAFAAALHLDDEQLREVLRSLYADSYMAGAKDAADTLGHSLDPDGVLAQAVTGVDWDTWKPGHPKASALVADGGFQRLLDEAGVVIRGIDSTTQERIGAAVEAGLRAGDGIEAIAGEIAKLVDSASRARLIAVTEVNRAMTLASAATYRENGVQEWDLLTQPDACPRCVAIRDANPHPMTDTAEMSPVHPMCLPGNARVVVPRDVLVGKTPRDTSLAPVQGGQQSALATTTVAKAEWDLSGVRAATERHFVGDLIEIQLANGYQLAATPNHPVATPRGWVPVAELALGQDVICCTGSEWEVDPIDPNVDYVPPTIQQVAESRPVAFGAMPTAPEDFHGDGAGSDVHVVWTNGLLRGDGQPPLNQHLGQEPLSERNVAGSSLDAQGVPGELLGAPSPPACGNVCCGGEPLTLSGGSVGHADTHSVSAPSGSNPRLQEESADGAAADAEGFCQSLLAHAPAIAVHQVVGIRTVPFAGHVFNLDTTEGWYISNGIVTHNCRCAITVHYDH